jgi:hypothetical protein
MVPAGYAAFAEHAMLADGTPTEPMMFDSVHIVRKR